jgi:signal peptidase I, archaeal type
MKKGYIKLLIISLILILSISTWIILGGISSNLAYIFFLVGAFTVSILILGIEKANYNSKKEIIIMTIAIAIMYLIFTYAIGLIIGFYKNSYNLEFLNILKLITPIICIIILEELLRYNLVKKGNRYKSILFLSVIIITLANTLMIIKMFNFNSVSSVIRLCFAYMLPFLTKNIFLTYATYKTDYKIPIIYRLILELPIYFMPIIPNLGIYIESVFKTVLPFILGFVLYIFYKKESPNVNQNTIVIKTVATTIFIACLFMIALNSGWFKYYTLTIGSGSMHPVINKGDIIIVEKLSEEEIYQLKEGEILVFNYQGRLIVHRIENIVKLDDDIYFYTKGDNNNGSDNYPIPITDVKGKVKTKLKYLGSLSVWLGELIEK